MKPYNTPNAGKKEEVKRMFDNIAPTYDRLNHILSLSIDRVWRRRVMRIVRRAHPRQILDLATGTGDLAILMAKRIPQAQVMGVDLSEKMLAEASEKVRRQGLDDHVVLYQGDAERLDLGDGAVDAVTVAFGVRNFGNMEAGLSEALRVLRGGGRLVVLEFSTPRNRFVRWAYSLYSDKILRPLGGMVSHDKQAYGYLPASIEEFPSPERFLEIMRGVGFTDCRRHSLCMGIAQIYIGKKV